MCLLVLTHQQAYDLNLGQILQAGKHAGLCTKTGLLTQEAKQAVCVKEGLNAYAMVPLVKGVRFEWHQYVLDLVYLLGGQLPGDKFI